MMNSIVVNSFGTILFLVLTIIPILLYFIWKFGYNLKIMKIPALLSVISAFYFYFTTPDIMFFIADLFNLIFEKLILLNFLFLSAISTIFIIILPSNQNNQEKSQTSITNEVVNNNSYLLEQQNNKFDNSPKTENKFVEVKNSDNEFQKFINEIIKEQNKKL